jgi:hypothetical protein
MAVDMKIRDCAVSCARTLETREIKTHEAHIVLGCLAGILADHSGAELETVLNMIGEAAKRFHSSNSTEETPKL